MKQRGHWTFEHCKEAAETVKTRVEFKRKYSGAYDAVLRNGWTEAILGDKPRLVQGKPLLVCGVGIYDGPRPAKSNPLHGYWIRMMERGYSTKLLVRRPTYTNVTVCKSWHTYSNFERWALTKGDVSGLELDKDILYPGNKRYSPKTCCFVPPYLNTFLNKSKAARGSLLPGVRRQNNGDFQGQLSTPEGRLWLGTYKTELEAHLAYRKARALHIRKIAADYPDPEVQAGLIRHAQEYELEFKSA